MIITLIIMMLSVSHASDMDSKAWALLNAKSNKALQSTVVSYNKKKELQTKCDFELEHNLIPRACYGLKLSQDKIRIIDLACEKASKLMTEVSETKGLSDFCSKTIEKKNLDLRYAKEETDPGSIIQF